MNLATKTMKRLGALLLVFAMVVGMLPVQVFAAEGDTVPFSFKLKRDKKTVNGVTTYTYSIEPEDGTLLPEENGDVQYYWDYDYYNEEEDPFTSNPNELNKTTYVTNESKSVAVKVVVDGLSLTAVNAGHIDGDGVTYSDKAVWRANVTMPEKIYVGVPFTLPNAVPARSTDDKNLGSGVTDAAIWTVYTINGKEYKNGETVTFTEEENVQISYTVHAGRTALMDDTDLPAARTGGNTTVQVNGVDLTPTYYMGDQDNVGTEITGEWVTTRGWFTIELPASVENAELTVDSMPPVTVDPANAQGTVENWAKSGMNFQYRFQWANVGETVTIKLNGENSATFKLDIEEPSISTNESSFYKSGDEHIVVAKVHTGPSGVAEVRLGTSASIPQGNSGKLYYTIESDKDNKDHTITIHEKNNAQVTGGSTASVTVTANNGKTGTGNIPGTIDLSIDVKKDGSFPNGSFAKDLTGYKYKVEATSGFQITSAELSDDLTNYVTSPGQTWEHEFTYAQVNGKTLTVSDGYRTKEHTFTTYQEDKTPPSAGEPTWPVGNTVEGVLYVKSTSTVNIPVVITETGSGLNASESKIEYNINGKGTQIITVNAADTYNIPVAPGETLLDYTITLTDNVGNTYGSGKIEKKIVVDGTVPSVTVTYSSNVKGIATNESEETYLQLGENVADDEVVTMTVKVEDDNLDTSGVAVNIGNVTEVVNGKSVTYQFSATVGSDDFLEYTIVAKDLAKNAPQSIDLTVNNEQTNTVATLNAEEPTGEFNGKLLIDRSNPTATPDFGVTTTSKASVAHNTHSENVPLYDGNIGFAVELNATDVGSGVANVEFTLTSGLSFANNTQPTKGTDGKYTFEVVPSENIETNDANLTVTITDLAGNKASYPYYFAVDTQAPRITIMNGTENLADDSTTTKYYKDFPTITLTVEDMFLNDMGDDWSKTENGATKALTLSEVKTAIGEISVTAKDKADHEVTKSNTMPLVVDKNPPVVTLTITNSKGEPVSGKFHKGKLTYTFTVNEQYLDSIALNYKISGTPYNMSKDDFTQGEGENANVYTYSFEVKNKESVTEYTISATDLAGNSNNGVTNGDNYNILVDDVPPVVEVTLDATSTRTDSGVDYFAQDKITYTIKVTDDTIDETVAVKTVTYTLRKADEQIGTTKTEPLSVSVSNNSKEAIYAIEVENGSVLEELSIKVKDAAGNVPAGITGTGGLTFAADTTDTSKFIYTGNEAVVDNTAPTATLTYALTAQTGTTKNAKLVGFAQRNGTNYLVLGKTDDAQEILAESITITATLTATDANLIAPTGWSKVPADSINSSTNSSTFTKEVTVNKNALGDISLNFTVQDKAGNYLETVTMNSLEDQTKPNATQDQNTKAWNIPMVIDFRRPTSGDAEAPTILINPTLTEVGTNGEINLYKGNLDTEMKLMTLDGIVYDKKSTSVEGKDTSSGLASVKYKLTDTGNAVVAINETTATPENNANSVSLSIPVKLTGNTVESNNVTLTLSAFDHAGNGINFSKTYGVDTLAPRINVDYGENDDQPTEVGGTKYYNADRFATITVTDINQGTTTVKDKETDLGWPGGADKVITKTVEFEENRDYNLTINSTDLAGNSDSYSESFIIDKTAPVVTVTKPAETQNYSDSIDYYNTDQTFTINVTDNYLDAGDNSGIPKAKISYTITSTRNDEGHKAVTVENQTISGQKGNYTHSFTLKDGQTLTDLSIEVMDNAGNIPASVAGFTKEGENGKFVYSGKDVCVDSTNPVLLVKQTAGSKGGEWDTYEFYNSAVTYQITLTDANGNLKDSSGYINQYSYTVNGQEIKAAGEYLALSGTDAEKTATFTIAEGDDHASQMLQAMFMQFTDAAGNPAVLSSDSSNEPFTSGTNTGEWNYSGKQIVVDQTKPKATVTFGPEEELAGFYTDARGVTYIKLKTPTKDENAKNNNNVTVTMYFTVDDYNLGIGQGLSTTGAGTWKATENGSWDSSNKYLINNAGKAVYEHSVTVATNATGQIELALHVEDLAGNIIDNINFVNINGTVPSVSESDQYFVKANAGDVTGIVTLDRRQPTTGDNNPPQIKVEPTVKPVGTTKDGIQLFNSSFGFKLNVNDGAYNTLNAGLQSVEWKVNDGGFVAAAAGTAVQNTHNYDNTINITSVGNGERNDLVLEVKAMDNVGNTITYQEPFALDTLAPRITVEFDNNDVRNDRYFRAERTATIMVDELNFDAAKTEIDSEIKNGAWGTDAQGRHVTTIDYDVDGDYTLHVSSTDLAGNHTPDGSVNYIGVACQEFTIDLTLPIIEVFYDPDIVSGVDEDGVDYYNANQHIGVRVIEHNFSENDVVDEFYINRDQPLGRGLGEFSDNGDNHNAAIVLENGNRYFFRVNYTDLAGNVADGYTSNFFSVDTVPPTIRTISELDNEQMNVVSGDLELQFVVEDAQDNLDTVHVVITHTNNSFETVMVSGPEFLTITPQKDRSTVTVNIANIQKLKNLDGIYTIELRAYDYAGNIVTLTPPMVISLNRFGSTFTTDDPFTKQFLTPGSDGVVYHNSVNGNLIIQEINPNRVFHDETLKEEGSVLTIVVNGRSIRLEEGEDYTMTVEKRGQEGSYWYCYTYEIDKKVFEEDGELRDGRYSILIYGVDEAGNNNTNESSEYSTLQLDGEGKYTGKIEFTIDTQAPVIITTGIESNEIYNEEFRQMQIEIADATPTSIQVYLNEELVGLSVDAANLPENTLWLTQDKETGIYTLNVNEQTGIFNSQNVRIVATDAAANAAEAEVNDFHISTSFLVRMLNSIWFYLILVAVAAGVVVLVVFSRKKKAAV